MAEQITKDEKKALRKLEWEEKAKLEKRNTMFKKYSIWGAVIAVTILAIGGLMWLVNQPVSTTSETVSVAPVSAKDITNGNSKAKVTLIEYSDFQCPACAAYYPIVKQILENNKDKIYFVYRIFPLTNIHPYAKISAQAAYAAHKQSRFFGMEKLLFTNQKDWSNSSDPKEIFIDYAKQLKLDDKKFQNDMNSEEAKKYVDNYENQATSEGINSTPTFILNGVKIINPASLEDFQKIIDNELGKK